MRPEDVYELAWVSEPRLSPDGTQVAYVVNRVDRGANAYRSAIFVAPVDGSEPARNLTSGERVDATPRWSPDGSRIAFVSNRTGGAKQLYVLPLAGGEPRRLTTAPEDVRGPVWSPDGTRLAFSSRVRDTLYEEEDEARRPPHRFTRLQFKLDNEGWTGDRRLHLFVVAADGSSDPVQITSGDYEHASPAWSPDGSRLAFISARDDDWDVKPVSDVYVMPSDGGEPVRVTGRDGICEEPAWSPDGQLIALRYEPGVFDFPRHAQIAVVDPEGRGPVRPLTRDLDRNCGPYPPLRAPLWDGDTLVFAAEDRGNTPLYRMRLDGSPPELLVGGELWVKDWDVAGGEIVHAASTTTTLTELYRGDERVTAVGDAFRRGRELVEPERFTAVSKDGSEVDAWIMRPVGYEAGGRYPVLLNIHGGPFTQYGNQFFDEFQIYAAAGYAVVYSNPRGSSGYSEDWGRAIRGPIGGGPGWGSVDYDDLIAVTDEALRRFAYCDPDRVGVLGGSYGGFMTSWIVGHTDRFRAACSERAVNHTVSFFGASDIGWAFKGYFGAFLWEDVETYLRLSPATYAENIRTPLLILHSEDDLRCPVEQAEQLFTVLR
ncbi:MAG: S9 family peptidase, partial [Actinomycetota bacterium]|nr:S9 family peptidase [Actinomycetota bacterium]